MYDDFSTINTFGRISLHAARVGAQSNVDVLVIAGYEVGSHTLVDDICYNYITQLYNPQH